MHGIEGHGREYAGARFSHEADPAHCGGGSHPPQWPDSWLCNGADHGIRKSQHGRPHQRRRDRVEVKPANNLDLPASFACIRRPDGRLSSTSPHQLTAAPMSPPW
jgi:hypothetical protein